MSPERKEPSDNTPMRTRTDALAKAPPRTAQPAAAQRGDPQSEPQNRASAACCALLRPTPAPAARPQTIGTGPAGAPRRVSDR
jgi:hypothetical protein